ncbi:hydrolase [Hymenobacter sp. BT18]|uniref:CPCC family cysteine-rich protein n=1 Tax=Hymenobacter sp. BT18 TaxID=2835648 RepID=UPI00143E66BC|nr:CPCC family cysteine-rich protein [Hymenobacter sp. BT18]QIX63185.1 hydrolase [Hymenobacter sp. BT18]
MYAVNRFGNYQCPCCGYFTLSEGRSNSFEICKVCFWKDDRYQLDNPEDAYGPNQVCLIESRRNFQEFGAMEKEFLRFVRPPKPEELPDA